MHFSSFAPLVPCTNPGGGGRPGGGGPPLGGGGKVGSDGLMPSAEGGGAMPGFFAILEGGGPGGGDGFDIVGAARGSSVAFREVGDSVPVTELCGGT